jgi:hypothetical protein
MRRLDVGEIVRRLVVWVLARYEKSDCTYTKSTNVLYCEARFRQEEQTTANLTVPDVSCATVLRLVQRTGLLVTTFRGVGLLHGSRATGEERDRG